MMALIYRIGFKTGFKRVNKLTMIMENNFQDVFI